MQVLVSAKGRLTSKVIPTIKIPSQGCVYSCNLNFGGKGGGAEEEENKASMWQ